MTTVGAAGEAPPRRLPTWLLLLMVAAIGLNLRASFGSSPPLIDQIGAELHLNATAQSLLTALPVVCMGLFAPIAQRLGALIGLELACFALLGLLCAGGLMRLGVDTVTTLYFSAILTGGGMGGVSALMPGLIVRHLPRIRGTATGIYSMAMALGVAVAAWIAGPTAELLNGWRPALALWGVTAGVTALCWLALLPWLSPPRPWATRGEPRARQDGLPWRSRTAWWVTAFTTLNMLIGFSGVAWIAPTFVHHGFPPQRAANLFALFQIIQLVTMVTLPPLTDITRDRRPLLAITVISTCLGVSAMVLAPAALALPAVLLFGTGVGGTSALALVLVQDAAITHAEASRLGAMVLLVSFAAGAVGPVLLGSLRDLTGGFTAGYATLFGLSAVSLLMLPVFRPGRSLNDVSSTSSASNPPSADETVWRDTNGTSRYR